MKRTVDRELHFCTPIANTSWRQTEGWLQMRSSERQSGVISTVWKLPKVVFHLCNPRNCISINALRKANSVTFDSWGVGGDTGGGNSAAFHGRYQSRRICIQNWSNWHKHRKVHNIIPLSRITDLNKFIPSLLIRGNSIYQLHWDLLPGVCCANTVWPNNSLQIRIVCFMQQRVINIINRVRYTTINPPYTTTRLWTRYLSTPEDELHRVSFMLPVYYSHPWNIQRSIWDVATMYSCQSPGTHNRSENGRSARVACALTPLILILTPVVDV
jgi:hypothetical protein